MFVIEDDVHAEQIGEYPAADAARAELRRLGDTPWDQAPNVAPCVGWRSCRREYHLIEYDLTSLPWRMVNRVPALNISADGVEWLLTD